MMLFCRIGRRWTHGGFLLVGGLSCVAWTVFSWLGKNCHTKVLFSLYWSYLAIAIIG